MSSVRRPRMPKPRIPKIKKPSISKAKKLRKKLPALSTGKSGGNTKTKSIVKPNSTHKKKHSSTRRQTGTCYLQPGCRNVLARDVSKTQCKKMGGKSWRKKGGSCERFLE